MQPLELDVAVVGAGFAGLTAARRLCEAGRRAVVLEARDRVGGRTESVTVEGVTVDLGGQWAGPGQDHLYRLAEELGVPMFAQYGNGDPVVLAGTRAVVWRDGVDAWPVVDQRAEAALVARLEELAATVPLDAPWTAPHAERFDAITVASWLEAESPTPGGAAILGSAVRNVLAAEPAAVSMLHLLFYVRAGGGWQSVVGLEDGAQKHRFVGGAQEVAVRLAGRLGDAVRLGWPVRRIERGDGGVVVTGEQGAVTAGRVVVAIPPTLAGRIVYDPPLPADRDQLTQRLPAGTVCKFHAIYDEPFWRTEGLAGIIQSTDAPCRITLDGSPPDGDVGVLTGFLEGRDATLASAMGAHDRRALVLNELARAFGPRSLHPLGYVDRDWSAEEWTRGCYGAHVPPGVWTQLGPALRTPVGRIHWAGTETAQAWMGYMEGAIRSGERAAQEVLAAPP